MVIHKIPFDFFIFAKYSIWRGIPELTTLLSLSSIRPNCTMQNLSQRRKARWCRAQQQLIKLPPSTLACLCYRTKLSFDSLFPHILINKWRKLKRLFCNADKKKQQKGRMIGAWIMGIKRILKCPWLPNIYQWLKFFSSKFRGRKESSTSFYLTSRNQSYL